MIHPHVSVVSRALSHAVVGDREQGLALLRPLVDDSLESAYAVLRTLAQVVVYRSSQAGPVTVTIHGLGEAEGLDGLPAPLRFTVRFLAACTEQDDTTATALFWSAAEPADGTPLLTDAVGTLFDLATASTRDAVREHLARRPHSGEDTP
ncbi:hypothetical protein ACPCSP_25815 [Streptomyces cinereoruber]|uniref:hypothetical protein n=1 Tax=Streptomyces cinereoruber TaxID=67260 RepID=UPI003C302A50